MKKQKGFRIGFGIEFEGEMLHAGFDTKKEAQEWLRRFKKSVKVARSD